MQNLVYRYYTPSLALLSLRSQYNLLQSQGGKCIQTLIYPIERSFLISHSLILDNNIRCNRIAYKERRGKDVITPKINGRKRIRTNFVNFKLEKSKSIKLEKYQIYFDVPLNQNRQLKMELV